MAEKFNHRIKWFGLHNSQGITEQCGFLQWGVSSGGSNTRNIEYSLNTGMPGGKSQNNRGLRKIYQGKGEGKKAAFTEPPARGKEGRKRGSKNNHLYQDWLKNEINTRGGEAVSAV